MEITVNEKEILRYLGYKGARGIQPRTNTNGREEVDERVLLHINELIQEFSANLRPKNTYSVFDCKVDGTSLTIGSLTVNSKNLCHHLSGCSRAALFAATLGTEADTLIRRYSVQDMEKAVIAQAICAVMIEAYCDSLFDSIQESLEKTSREGAKTRRRKEGKEVGIYTTTRFSPGYGDFDIAHQKDILSILNCSRIGLTLTEGNMLVPTKSITAVIGFSSEKKNIADKCEQCDSPCDMSPSNNNTFLRSFLFSSSSVSSVVISSLLPRLRAFAPSREEFSNKFISSSAPLHESSGYQS